MSRGPDLKPRKVIADTLQSRVAEYFDGNPDESLTYLDAATKFGVSVMSVRYAVRELSKRGQVQTMFVICRGDGQPRADV